MLASDSYESILELEESRCAISERRGIGSIRRLPEKHRLRKSHRVFADLIKERIRERNLSHSLLPYNLTRGA
jgi:hypothetical protein